MATTANMRMLTAEHLIGGTGTYHSADEATVDGGAAPGIPAGTILGQVTATGVFVRHAPGATNGSQNVAGVLFEQTTGVQQRRVDRRDKELTKGHLTYAAGADTAAINATDTALRALGLIPRL